MTTPKIIPDYCAGFVCPAASNVDPPGEATPPPAQDLDNKIPVVNVRDWIVTANSSYAGPEDVPPDELREIIRTAAASVPATGGILYLPNGYYLIEGNSCLPIAIGSNTWVLGDGPGTILDQKTDNVPILVIAGVSHVRVSNIHFVFDHTCTDFPVAIEISSGVDVGGTSQACGVTLRASDIIIEECSFETGSDATIQPAQVILAILATGIDGLWVRNNKVVNAQFKIGNYDALNQVYVQNNHFIDPFDYAISCVGSNPHTTFSFKDVHITGNIIENAPSHGAIYVGPDGQALGMVRFDDLVVRGNIVRGAFAGPSEPTCVTHDTVNAAVGLTLYVPPFASNWIVADNIIENIGPAFSSSIGVFISGSGTLTSLTISNNEVRNFDFGIKIECNAQGVRVVGNVVDESNGLLFLPVNSLTDTIIARNQIATSPTGAGVGVHIQPHDQAVVRRVLICENICFDAYEDTAPYTYAGVQLTTQGTAGTIEADIIGNVFESSRSSSNGVWLEDLGSGGNFGGTRVLENKMSVLLQGVRVDALADDTVVVRGNSGTGATRAKGIVPVPSTVTSVTFAHGLTQPLHPEDVKITALDAVEAVTWVTIDSPTTVTLHCARPTATDTSFAYRIG